MDPMMRVSRRNFTTTVAAALMLSQVGCATFATSKTAGSNGAEKKTLLQRMPWAKDKNEAPEPYPNPVKIASTWTPDTLVQTGHTPTRGFGGRLFFYDEKSRPVPVEGQVIHMLLDTAVSLLVGGPAVAASLGRHLSRQRRTG